MLQNALVSRLRDWIGDGCKQIDLLKLKPTFKLKTKLIYQLQASQPGKQSHQKTFVKVPKSYMMLNWRLVDNSQKYRYPLKIERLKKKKKKVTRVTQLHGSMEANKILDKIKMIKS